MVNKKLDEAVLDTVLEQAFAEAFKRDIAKIEEENKDMPEHPKKYVDIERAYYKKMTKPKTSGMLVFRKVAACIMAVLSVGFITVLAVSDVRASVWDSAVSLFEKYASFSTKTKDNSLQLGEYSMGYLPKEFELTKTNSNEYINEYTFSNGADYFLITEYKTNESKIDYDYENGEYKKIIINGNEAFLISYSTNDSMIIWLHNEKSFSIEGTININILIKVAENIF
ncbi:MAG: DUF4367 domain-containing protein [Clostridia bacterium]|nr:DUF4367 domain-containing protein [Clostridia bacterium]